MSNQQQPKRKNPRQRRTRRRPMDTPVLKRTLKRMGGGRR